MSAENQRAERRIKSKGQFALAVGVGQPILADACDIFISRICLEAGTRIELGTAVRLDGNGLEADGMVRYCRFDNGP
jgi:hypothetical protein